MPSPSPTVVIVCVVLGAAVATAGWALGAPPAAAPSPVGVVEVSVPAPTLVVHVGGAVARPGLVTLPAGARVADAVRAAGGMLPVAAAESVNLARLLVDGERLLVGDGAAPVAPGDAPVSLNTATREELEALPGVGPVLAGRIVEHRDAAGPFAAVEDLLAVPGIGERMLESLRDRVRVP